MVQREKLSPSSPDQSVNSECQTYSLAKSQPPANQEGSAKL
ncbi:Uncharacterized protein dnm_012980 [Desulfonema magnum]|uniref:Uncharacterized protein n=1 Tax=Desulfonema magnum TaxID=45655 RepID=A0A975BHA1_9BACT|nr:Uncharacterized protein dnm_012980 [Desulfonema magnum]